MKVMINEYQMADKQQCISLCGAIKNNSRTGYRTRIEEVTVQELAAKIKAGHTIIPGLLDESKKLTSSTWTGQQLFALDFDNSVKVSGVTKRVEDKYYMSYERIMNICKEREMMPALVYETFSSSEEIGKYRVVFCNDVVITFRHAAAELLGRLASMFDIEGVPTTDRQCTDAGRLFFPGRKILYAQDNYMHVENEPSIVDWAAEEMKNTKSNKNASRNQRKTLSDKENSPTEFSSIHKNISSYVCSKNPTHIKALNAKALRAILGPENITFDSKNEAINYIQTEVDMAAFLGIGNPKSFNCIVHEDSKPSAGIMRANSGKYYYNCFSCGFRQDLIGVVEHIQGTTRNKALKFIMDVLNIKVEVPEAVQEARENLEENMRMILDGEIEEVFPVTHSIIRRYRKDLLLLHTIAMNSIGLVGDRDDKYMMFFSSQTYMAKMLETHQANLCKRTATFSFLKLLEKVDDHDVPADLLGRAKDYSARKQIKDTIQFYRIPAYGWTSLKEVDKMAKAWKSNAGTMAGISREWIYRSFGESEADRVYPKRKGIVPTESSDKFQERFEIQLMKIIEKKGYAKEVDVLDKLYGYKELNATKIKRVLSESLKNLGLTRVRTTKDLKEKHAIKGNGYPFILIRK